MKDKNSKAIDHVLGHDIAQTLKELNYSIEEGSHFQVVDFVRYKNSKEETEKQTICISYFTDGKTPEIAASRKYYRDKDTQDVRDFNFYASDLDEINAYIKKHLGRFGVLSH